MVLFFLPATGNGGFMRAFMVGLLGLVVTLATSAVAQQAPPVKTYASSADVAALIAKAKADRKENQANFIQQILQLAPYNANLEYRAAVGPAAVHEKEAEMFYVIDGSGTLVTGGKLVGETRTNAENLSGTAIEGGSSRPVAKGDFFIVPENTPHWFGTINGTLVLMSLHVPRTSAVH
jgi:mannose-6-phosphate isomerase-like protein (cupin superfamily)